jgi:MinD-like ATPase involved in chromosome partitioning or flagellar assembly
MFIHLNKTITSSTNSTTKHKTQHKPNQIQSLYFQLIQFQKKKQKIRSSLPIDSTQNKREHTNKIQLIQHRTKETQEQKSQKIHSPLWKRSLESIERVARVHQRK